jgi:hypothetical protein
MITLTFTPQGRHSLNVLIEAWLCGARLCAVYRFADPESDAKTYFDTPEVHATMAEIAQPVIDRLREHFNVS